MDIIGEESKIAPELFTTSDDSAYFSEEEQSLARNKISLLKIEFSQLALPEVTIRQLYFKLDQLADQATGLSKTNWKELFIGGIIGTIMNLALTPETAKQIWGIIRRIFSQLVLTR